ESVALSHTRQILLLLLGRAPVLDHISCERVIVHDRCHRRRRARQRLDHFHVADKAGSRAANFARKQQSQEVMLRQPLHYLFRKFTSVVQFNRDRFEIFLRELPGALPDQCLLFSQFENHLLTYFLRSRSRSWSWSWS